MYYFIIYDLLRNIPKFLPLNCFSSGSVYPVTCPCPPPFKKLKNVFLPFSNFKIGLVPLFQKSKEVHSPLFNFGKKSQSPLNFIGNLSFWEISVPGNSLPALRRTLKSPCPTFQKPRKVLAPLFQNQKNPLIPLNQKTKQTKDINFLPNESS